MKFLLSLLAGIGWITMASAQTQPSGLTVKVNGSRQVVLTWKDNSPNEQAFEIERAFGFTNLQYAKIGETGASVTTYTDNNLPRQGSVYYRVRARLAASAFSAYSTEADGILPDIPVMKTAEAKGTGWIYLTFHVQGGKDAGNAIVQRRQGQSGAWATIGAFDSNLQQYDDKAVPLDNTEFCYRVYFDAYPADLSNVLCATTLAAVPGSPGGLSATAVSSSRIDLKWTDNSDNETDFLIQRSADGTSFTDLGTVPANTTAYAHTGLSAHTRIYYRVWARRGAQISRQATNVADATTLPAAPQLPTAPANLQATAASSSQINLSWTDNSGNETGFEVEWSADGLSFTKIADNQTNTFSNTGLSASTKYYYRVRAVNQAGASGYTNVANATTSAPPKNPPSAPSALSAAAMNADQIDLAWQRNSTNEAGFEVEQSLSAAGPFTKITSTQNLKYTALGLAGLTTYYFRVRAYNTDGPSGYSNVASATTPETIVSVRSSGVVRIDVYPNPFDEILQVRAAESAVEAEVRVYDANGLRRGLYHRISLTAGVVFNLATSSWKPGVYLLEIRIGESITRKRLVKQ